MHVSTDVSEGTSCIADQKDELMGGLIYRLFSLDQADLFDYLRY